jgi:hypothetical protein
MLAKSIGFLGLTTMLFASPAFGHHSYAMYDDTEAVLIEGTVRSFDWTNPHGWLYVTVTDEAGQTLEWSIEMGSTSTLAQAGWRPRTVVPGDVVSVAIHLLREELQPPGERRAAGAFLAIVLPDGTHIGDAAYLN